MFSFDLDHLNILIMFILAFFSFRAYNSNSLAIQYEPQQQLVEEDKKEADQQVEAATNQEPNLSQMTSEPVDNTQNAQNSAISQTVQVPDVQIDVENVGSYNLQLEITAEQNKNVQTTSTVQGSNSYLTGLVNEEQLVEKDEEQESTLVNRVQSGLTQEPCDEEGNVECLSSSDDSGVSSQGIYPDLDCEEGKETSRREKRKQIKKAKKVLKKSLRKQQQVRLEGQVASVETQ